MPEINQQKYFCEKCGLKSCVDYKAHAGVFEVIYLVEDDHAKHSPGCDQNARMLKIINDV